jgi:hypothetical protein
LALRAQPREGRDRCGPQTDFSQVEFDAKTRESLAKHVRSGLAAFIVLGLLAGFVGFWGLPVALPALVPYDSQAYGPGVFVFLYCIFINVHHYFLDSVMWRRENPEVKKYLLREIRVRRPLTLGQASRTRPEAIH